MTTEQDGKPTQQKLERVPLASGELHSDELNICDMHVISESGASGLVYQGISRDYYGEASAEPAQLVVKECYPLAIVAEVHRQGDALIVSDKNEASTIFNTYLEKYSQAFANNIALYQGLSREQISKPNKLIRANGTAYLVNDVSHALRMDFAFKEMSLYEQIRTLIKICEALSAIHEQGYLYLDLKPENILCVKNPDSANRNKFYDSVRFIDFDTLTKSDELNDGLNVIPNSGDWSAYEQTHVGYAAEIGFASDIYSVGAILFWVLVGKPPLSNEVIHAHGRWNIALNKIRLEHQPLVREEALAEFCKVFDKTLVVETAKRYAQVHDLQKDLEMLSHYFLPVPSEGAMYDELNALKNQVKVQSELLNSFSDSLNPKSYHVIRASKFELEEELEKADAQSFNVENGVEEARGQNNAGKSEIDKDTDKNATKDDIDKNASKDTGKDSNASMSFEDAMKLAAMLPHIVSSGYLDAFPELKQVMSSQSNQMKDALKKRDKPLLMQLSKGVSVFVTVSETLLLGSEVLDALRDVPDGSKSAIKESLDKLAQAVLDEDVQEAKRLDKAINVELTCAENLMILSQFAKSMEEYLTEATLNKFDAKIEEIVSAMQAEGIARMEKLIDSVSDFLEDVQEEIAMGMLSNL